MPKDCSMLYRCSLFPCRYFYATLHLGTPPKQFAVIVDTGSTITYVPCASCGRNCGPHHKVRPLLDSPLSIHVSVAVCMHARCTPVLMQLLSFSLRDIAAEVLVQHCRMQPLIQRRPAHPLKYPVAVRDVSVDGRPAAVQIHSFAHISGHMVRCWEASHHAQCYIPYCTCSLPCRVLYDRQVTGVRLACQLRLWAKLCFLPSQHCRAVA